MTQSGREVRDILASLFQRHAEGLESHSVVGPNGMDDINASLKRVERYWSDQIRYIY